MPDIDISTHSMLSDKAMVGASGSQQDQAVFQANVESAQMIHHLTDEKYYTAELVDVTALILVFQVNYQYENDSNMELYEKVREGDTDFQYRDNAGVSPMAERLRNALDEKAEGRLRILKPKTVHSDNNTQW